jgi:hypothetical protein
MRLEPQTKDDTNAFGDLVNCVRRLIEVLYVHVDTAVYFPLWVTTSLACTPLLHINISSMFFRCSHLSK